MLSNHCLSVLSVTLVYCGQTVGWIKMKLGTQVDLSPGHIVSDGDQLTLHQRGTATPPQKNRPISVAAKWLHGSRCHLVWSYRSWPRRLCVRWGPRSPSPKGGGAPPKFSAHVYCGQTAGWMKLVLGMEVGFSPADFVLDASAQASLC